MKNQQTGAKQKEECCAKCKHWQMHYVFSEDSLWAGEYPFVPCNWGHCMRAMGKRPTRPTEGCLHFEADDGLERAPATPLQ